MKAKNQYSRVLLKLSGESLMGDHEFGFDPQSVEKYIKEISELAKTGVSVAIVVGGGNLFRGVQGASRGMVQAKADQMGMLATIMNAIALEDAFKAYGTRAIALSAISMPTVCEPYTRDRALNYLEQGNIVICAGGTGNPFFTTDTASALRAVELQCDVLLKGTQVDGVYSADPKKDPDATRFDQLSYDDVLKRDLKVMDAAAFALARDNNIPILVFSIHDEGQLTKAVNKQGRYTLVGN